MSELLRHIAACNNTTLPGGRVKLWVEGGHAGWLDPADAERLRALGAEDRDGIRVGAEQLTVLARQLSEAGAFRWRGEAFDVRAAPGGPVLAQLDRGALPLFGVEAAGAHLNGLVEADGETKLWVARRAANRALDPGKLDHLAAGGVGAGYTPESTLLKEAEEEAGLAPALTRGARRVATISYTMQRKEGLRRDRIHCFELTLPADFRPENRDGEVEAFELWPLERVLDTVRRTDDFKFNVNLALIDLFIRRGMLGPEEARTLRDAGV